MTWKVKFICPECGYEIKPEYVPFVNVCPECGGAIHPPRLHYEIPEYDDHTVSGLLED